MARASARGSFESILIKRVGRKGFKTYMAAGWIRVVAILITLHFVSLTMLFFPQSVQTALMTCRNFLHAMAT